MGRTHGRTLRWLWGSPTILLALGVLAFGASAEEGEKDGSKTVSFDVSGEREVTQNDDGSKTINTTVTRTNAETGAVRTKLNEVNVQKTETGKEWTRDTSVTGSNGFNLESSTSGSSTRNGDGSGIWESVTDGSVTRRNGNSVDYTTERAGDWQKNDIGGRDFSSTATTTTSNGGTSTVNRNLSTYQVSDGVKGFSGDSHRSFGNGASVDRSVEGSVTKTDSGRSWEATVEGTKTGPNGNTRSWTGDVDGSVTRNGDGTVSVDKQKTVTGEKGGSVSVDKSGTLSKGDDGKWHYDGSKDVTRTKPPAPESPGASAASQSQKDKWSKWKAAKGQSGTNSESPRQWAERKVNEATGSSAADRWNRWKQNTTSGNGSGTGAADRWSKWKQYQQNGGLRNRATNNAGDGAGAAWRNRVQANRAQNASGANSGNRTRNASTRTRSSRGGGSRRR